MFGAFKKVAQRVASKFEALVNEEELKAVVGAAVLIAAADGNVSDAEKETAFRVISQHESLTGFNQATIRKHFDSAVKLINGDRQLAEEELRDWVSTIKERVARIRVLGIAKEIAAAEDGVSKEEQAVLDKIRQWTA